MQYLTVKHQSWIFLLFAVSGFSGLIYEAIWARYLKLFLGHSSYGQILTLCIYMGGLGAGSFIAGKNLHRIKNLLLAYSVCELCIGIGGFIYHPVYVFTTRHLFNSGLILENTPVFSSFLKTGLAVIITFPMSILLGMTFPFITAGLMRLKHGIPEEVIPSVYFSNSIGAAIGILCTSFYFIPNLGTYGSLLVAGTLNILLASVFYIFFRNNTPLPQKTDPKFLSSINDYETTVMKNRLFLIILAFATGFSSFLYEIGWMRLLTLLLGSSTHSFDLMVSAFILGLSIGAFFVSRQKLSKNLLLQLAWVQILMGLCIAVPLFFYKPFFHLVNLVFVLFRTPKQSYFFVTILKYTLCILMMCPASFFAGMTLPLITYGLCRATKDETYTGRIYGWNTIGSISGAAIGGLIVLPLIQLERTFFLGAIVDIAFGTVLLFIINSTIKNKYFSGLACLFILICTVYFKFDDRLINSGVFRYFYHDKKRTVWVRDGKTATISVYGSEKSIIIRTNGKVDASLDTADLFSGDNITQAGIAFYSMALKNDPYTAAVIGLGSGMTAQYLLSDPLLKKMDLIEIEEEMYNLSKHFRPYNNRIFTDSRFKIHFQDARTYFASKQEPYDLIISEPSNPWVSGVSSLFTKEFYAQLKKVLKHDGILVQWIHLYEFNNELLMSIFKAIHVNFKCYKVYAMDEDNSNVCILISDKDISICALDRFANTPSIRSEFEGLNIPVDRFSDKYYHLSQSALADLMKYYEVNSDFLPVVDNLSEQAFYLRSRADLFEIYGGNISFYQEFYENPQFAPITRNIASRKMDEEYDTVVNSLEYLFESVSDSNFVIFNWPDFINDFIDLYPYEIWPVFNDSIPIFDSICLYVENRADEIPEKNEMIFHYYLLKNNIEYINHYLKKIISVSKKGRLPYPYAKNLFIASLKINDKQTANLVHKEYLSRFLTKKIEEKRIIDELLKK
ncbi:MAG: spermine synthase [Chitinispirillia bacterium]|jgi:predicted membrane-bound spermidine synthase